MQPQAETIGFVVRDGQKSLVLHRKTFPIELFEEAIPLLERALEHTQDYRAEDLYESCREGKAQFWTLRDADEILQMVMISTFVEYPRVKDLHICALAGWDLRSALRFLPSVKEFMAWNDASRITAAVRPQFMRVLQRYGFGELDRRAVLSVTERPNATRH